MLTVFAYSVSLIPDTSQVGIAIEVPHHNTFFGFVINMGTG